MSFSPKFYVVEDPAVSTRLQPEFSILKGSRTRTYQPYVCVNTSNSSTQWSIIPPDPTTVINRNIYLAMPVKITLSRPGGGPGNVLDYGNTDAFKAYPLASVMSTLSATLNNLSVSCPVSDVMPWLARYSTYCEDERSFYSQFPSYQDRSQSYDELVNTLENPLGGFPANSTPYSFKRGQFPVTIISNTPTSAEIVAVIVEPLFMSPFLFKGEREPGFYGIRNFTLNITWDGTLNKIWSRVFDPLNPTTVTASFQNVTGLPPYVPTLPTLYLRYDTPESPVTLSEPHFSPYYQIDRFPTDAGIVAGGATVEHFTAQNIQLTGIPGRLYILFRRQNQDLTPFTPNVCASIRAINITFANVTGILSTASIYDIYQIAIKNGFQGTFTDWLGNAPGMASTSFGSVLALDFGEDIALPQGMYPGMSGTYQLLVKATFTNPSPDPIHYSMYVITVSQGEFHTIDSTASTSINIITPQDVQNTSGMDVRELKHNNFYGGAILDAIKRGVGVLARGYNKILPTVQNTLSGIGKVAQNFEGFGFNSKRPRLDDTNYNLGGDFMSLDDLKAQVDD